MDLTGPNGIVQLRLRDAESFYENEEENISEQIETYYQGFMEKIGKYRSNSSRLLGLGRRNCYKF